MDCQKKIKLTNSRCRDKAVAETEIGTKLCRYHFDFWIKKLHSRGISYYKGIVRRTDLILHFIYLDCKSRNMQIEPTMQVMLRHTHYNEYQIIEFMTKTLQEGQEEFLKHYPNWKQMLKKPRRL